MNDAQSLIRNFCVISHIDHGKTTLTDRFLELTGTVLKTDLNFQDRLLDSNPIERERGITIKLAPVKMHYILSNRRYELNLIDTPGHVDFSYEVSRSLAACESAVLLVDATQGIQAQTMANAYHALEHNLDIIPVVNKIDLPNANISKTKQELVEAFGFKSSEIFTISAKTGESVIQLIKAIIELTPSPKGDRTKPLRALIFNSFYHPHHGVIAYLRVFDGQINSQDRLRFFSNQTSFKVDQVGFFSPQMQPTDGLFAGQVGYVATGLKDLSLCHVGDTLIKVDYPALTSLPGYQEPQPMVFMDLYPIQNQDHTKLAKSLDKLKLVDSSLTSSPVNSASLGSGFKVGFQGLLHADIVQERLEREFNLELIITSPSVEYQATLHKNNQVISIFSPADYPDPTLIKQIKEPYIILTIFTPSQYLGNIIELLSRFRAEVKNQQYFGQQVKLTCSMPLQELVSDFFGTLKSTSSGFASLDWRLDQYRPADIVKLAVLLNHQPVDALSVLVPRFKASTVAAKLAQQLKLTIPRQNFEVPIQIALGGQILARETIKAYRKDVTAKLYGGDPTRRQKLLSKQKKGKKRMKLIGQVHLPQEAFLSILKK